MSRKFCDYVLSSNCLYLFMFCSGVSVRNLQAFQVLQTVFLKVSIYYNISCMCVANVRVGALQPGSYWDISSALPLVGGQTHRGDSL